MFISGLHDPNLPKDGFLICTAGVSSMVGIEVAPDRLKRRQEALNRAFEAYAACERGYIWIRLPKNAAEIYVYRHATFLNEARAIAGGNEFYDLKNSQWIH